VYKIKRPNYNTNNSGSTLIGVKSDDKCTNWLKTHKIADNKVKQ